MHSTLPSLTVLLVVGGVNVAQRTSCCANSVWLVIIGFINCKSPRIPGSAHVCEPHTHTIRELINMCIGPLIICHVCGPHIYIIRDYKSSNPRVNA